MTVANPSFETAGAAPGLALGWTFSSQAAAMVYADFDAGVPQAVEDFEEEWNANEAFVYAFEVADLTGAEYQTASAVPKYFEDFEQYWSSNQNYAYGVVGSLAVYDIALAGTANFEGFDQVWDSNEDYLYALGASVSAGVESFEGQWDANESYFYALGATVAASYDTGIPESVEDFDEEWVGHTMSTL